MSSRLRGKICMVNGVASTLGEAIARRFNDEGAIVVGVDRNMHAIGDLVLRAELSDETAVEQVFRTANERFGRIDVIYNNMGLQDRDDHSIVDTSLETWNRVFTANLTSIFLCCKHGVPVLRKNGPAGGAIINSASFLAQIGAATAQMAYSAAKAAVVQLSRDLGVHLARSGIRVNAVCYGPIATPQQQAVFDRNPGALEKRLIHWPMGRFGTLDEAAATVAFLASDEAGFITAAAIPLDGGITAAFTVPE